MDRRDFGGRLRAVRRARGVSQERLGELLGLSHAAVSRWEANESRPTFENLEGLHEHLGVSLDTLIFGNVGASPAESRVSLSPPPAISSSEWGDSLARLTAEQRQAVLTMIQAFVRR